MQLAHLGPLGWMLERLSEGFMTVALADERAPGGGLPYLMLRIRDDEGNPLPEASHFWNPDSRMRACATLGLAHAAHQAWSQQEQP